MTTRVDSSKIEDIVGISRHPSAHYGRAVSSEETFYILHSGDCLQTQTDLNECEFSLALDKGVNISWWREFMDEPVPLEIRDGSLHPLLAI